ncbi:unnamed protein product [Symbiodinium pilosum]|uniref:Uncharacterized protein n=1 Tax=Symbiodinium pilosum TaxID=2952 RepID=A0A812VLX0_SYMPI|nr:unnamed protein product [Symbiodinium pilosum]
MSMIQIPVTLVTLAGEKPYTLTWQTSVPADEYVSSALGSSPEVGGVRFNVAKPMLVDGRATAKNVRLVEYNREGVQTKVCTWGCTERGYACAPFEYLKLESVPGMLHYLASQVLTQQVTTFSVVCMMEPFRTGSLSCEELLAVEEAPFRSSGLRDVGAFVNQHGGTWGCMCSAVASIAGNLENGFPGGKWAWPKFRDTWNYNHKVFSMGDIAREKGYSYILSMDDDVLLPASTMANGVPSVELWADEFLTSSEKHRLFECFRGSQVRSPCNRRNEAVEAILPKVWDGPAYYRLMAAYAKGKQYGPINGRLAGHPVRYNNTCGALALGLALDHASREWLRWRDDHSLIHGEDAWAERRYSFLNGTCYCKTVQ